MKRRLFFFVGALCTFGFYSCTKTTADVEAEESDLVVAERRAKDCDCDPSATANIFDPTRLVAKNSCGLDTIQKGFGFTEGPAVDKWGNVYFTDQPNDKIYRWDANTGKVTLFLQGTGRANGMMFDKKGNLIAAADLHGELWKIRPNGSHEVIVNSYKGKLLNGPNDVWINPKTGGMYITDPMFPRGYWDANDPRKTGNPGWPPVYSEQGPGIAGHVYYLAPGSKRLVRVTSATDPEWSAATSFPNGVVGTPDGKKLYVNRWAGNNKGGTFVFDIRDDGRLTNMKKFTEYGGDGMSMDEKGNVYISNGLGVMAFNKHGQHILTIPTGGGATNNVFAGKDEKTLFVTGPVDRITSIKMGVRGVEKFDGYGYGHDNDHGHGHGHGHHH